MVFIMCSSTCCTVVYFVFITTIVLALENKTEVRRVLSIKEAIAKYWSGYFKVLGIPGARSGNVSKEFKVEEEKNYQEDVPYIIYADARQEKYYTVLMLHLGAPPSKKLHEAYLNWLITNLKGSDFSVGITKNADAVAGYKRPYPRKRRNTGTLKRKPRVYSYEFMVYVQLREIQVPKVPDISRKNFIFKDWMGEEMSALLGPIEFATFYTDFTS